MRKYTVYFEIFGKKMKTTIEAYNEDAAIKVIESKIKYHRIDEEKDKEDVSEEFLNFFNDIVNGKGKK